MGIKASTANLLSTIFFHAATSGSRRGILGVSALAAASAGNNNNESSIEVPVGSSPAFSSSSTENTNNNSNNSMSQVLRDLQYPGTAVERMINVRDRVKSLAQDESLLDAPWPDIRRRLLWAGGLRDLPQARPGQGYTGHSFNDFNHVDLTCMLEQVSDNTNQGRVAGIAQHNRLGEGIRVASLPELGPGGSWSTCAQGCHTEPPQDVAHVQFQARIAFKLVWVPSPNFDMFCLVDDDGKLLAKGKPLPDSNLPPLRERQMNYRLVQGSKYAKEADKIAAQLNDPAGTATS